MSLIRYLYDFSSLSNDNVNNLLNRIERMSHTSSFNPHTRMCEFFLSNSDMLSLIQIPDSCTLVSTNQV